MSDFTTLLPYGLTRTQKVAHEHVLEAMRALITDIGTMRSLIKRVGLKLEVLDTTISAPDITSLETIVSDVNTQLTTLLTWTGNLEANYTGTV